jgi:4-hydroxy-3-methylbut-2-enyl diphosphate reductase
MEVILARPRGFCKGVVRAIDLVEQLLTSRGAPVYVLHEIVHNRYVVESLNERGALFVETVEDVPSGALVVFSAHGVSDAVGRRAKQRRRQIIDATCPLVKKVHFRARRYGRRGLEVIIIGHKGHPEVEGTMGCVDGPLHVVSTLAEAEALRVEDPKALAYVTQTTLNIKDAKAIIAHLKDRFPGIKGPGLADICYATQSRQRAVHRLAGEVDLLLVVGSRNSSNSNRLREVGEQAGCLSYLIEDARDMDPAWFTRKNCVGVTAGASAPEVLVEGVVEKLRNLAIIRVKEMDSAFEEKFTHEWTAVLSPSRGVEATSDPLSMNAL